MNDIDLNRQRDIDQFISDVRRQSGEGMERSSILNWGRYNSNEPQPHCSRQQPQQMSQVPVRAPVPPQLSKAEEMVWDTENFRTRVVDVPGRLSPNNLWNLSQDRDKIVYHSALLDEDYLIVGNYVEEQLRRKIGNGEYVDFARLMPRDWVGIEDDHRMEMVNRNGMTYWVPVSDRESVSINGYQKWEQAFHVFSNIYTYYHLGRAGELIQYNHIIHTASQTFLWDNIYRYDREFCIHMSKHHLVRSWSVILQQAWAMCLKDKIQGTPNISYQSGGSHRGGNGAKRRLCFDYNSGNCTFGKKCKFDHRCSFCNKFCVGLELEHRIPMWLYCV